MKICVSSIIKFRFTHKKNQFLAIKDRYGQNAIDHLNS